jgi:RsiW-degrading membrane proteinase PrsW (M82 family)
MERTRHGWIAVLVIGVALTLAVERALVLTRNLNLAPSLILLGATTVPAAFLTFLYGRRLPYDVGAGTVAVAALLGGVVGSTAAGVIEYNTQHALGTLPTAGIGVIEEGCKLLVAVGLLLVLRHHRAAADGLLLGVAVGAGFAALETMGYAFTTLVNSHDDVVDALDLLALRGLLSPAGHLAWTGIVATALYAAAESGWALRRVVEAVAAFGVAVGLHTAWDATRSLPVMAAVAAVSLTLLAWTAHRTTIRQQRSEPDPHHARTVESDVVGTRPTASRSSPRSLRADIGGAPSAGRNASTGSVIAAGGQATVTVWSPLTTDHHVCS